MLSIVELLERAKQHVAIEAGLPAHLLWCMADDIRNKGWVLRQDVFMHLSRAAAAALAGFDTLTARRLATEIDNTAAALLRDQSFSDPRTGIMACALFTLRLVSEGLFPDVTNQAVLISTLLIDDSKDMGSDLPGHTAQLQAAADSMLIRARLSGYYTKTLAQTPVNQQY